MRTEYKRDMNHNYLILTGDERIDTDSYQVRMIVANAVPDLLRFYNHSWLELLRRTLPGILYKRQQSRRQML